MNRVSKHQAYFNALLLCVERGAKLYWPDAPSLQGYSPKIRRAVVRDWPTAVKLRAYSVERPFYGNNRHGWRLVRFVGDGGGQSESGPMFESARAFTDALRLAREVVR